MGNGNGSDRFSKRLLEQHSQVRSMMAEASGNIYMALETFAAARGRPGSVVIFEGDYGGTIYLTIPVREVACDEAALEQLLIDIDAMCWSDSRGARMVMRLSRSVRLFLAGWAVAKSSTGSGCIPE